MALKHLLLLGTLAVVGCQDNDDDGVRSSRRDQDSLSDNRGSTGAGGSTAASSNEMAAMKDGKLAQPGSLSARDQQFVLNAASAGLFELKSSQLALSRANDPEVKRFAQQMITDHQKVNAELASLVRGKGAAVPTAMVPRHQKMIQTLADADSDDFVQAYKHGQGVAHDEAIALFQAASKNVDDRDLQAFASRNLGALKTHKDMLKDNGRHMGH